jgi:hypothetical protein
MKAILSYCFLILLACGLFWGVSGVEPAPHASLALDLLHGKGLELGLGAFFLIGSTNRLVLKDVDQFMADYTPVYQPLYPLFLGQSQQYSEEVGLLNFKRLEAVGDIRGRHITPKDTDIKQIAVKEGSKTFKKYFLANQFVQSALQDTSRTEDVVRQVLDEHQKQFDEMMVKGEGTQNSDVVNNGLFWSGDSNLIVNSSAELDTDADAGGAIGLHSKVMEQAEIANAIAGRKIVIFYGANIVPIANGLFASSPQSVKKVIQDSLGAGYAACLNLASNLTPASNHGFMIVNLDQVKLHYTALPKLKAQGVNEEKMYSWHNFIMGSCMLELLASGAVIKQPLTVEA